MEQEIEEDGGGYILFPSETLQDDNGISGKQKNTQLVKKTTFADEKKLMRILLSEELRGFSFRFKKDLSCKKINVQRR